MVADGGRRVIVEKNVPVPMRDGTVLRADVYRPDDGDSHPVLLTRLPYSKDIGWGTGYLDLVRAALRGYVVVVQDVRGRFQSDGAWVPFENEFTDGYDTVAWASQLRGADGRVAMFGASYFGMTQWQAAVERPPGLAALVPAMTWGNYLNGVVARGGAHELGLSLYWHTTALAINSLFRTFAGKSAELLPHLVDLVRVIDHVPEEYSILPLADLPNPDGLIPHLFDWFKRSIDDPYWQALAIDRRYDRVDVPTLHIAGWYDTFLGETLAQYAAMKCKRRRHPTSPRLIIGPWTHGNFSGVQGQLNFGLASSGLLLNYRGDLTETHLAFYDSVLGGRQDALTGQAPVQLFVMGENRWRGYDDWPVPGAIEERWYLHSEGEANTRSGDGTLTRTPPGSEPEDTYSYDPADPVPTRGGALLVPPVMGIGPLDQGCNEDRRDVLCYTSEPFDEAYTILGPLSVTLQAVSSATDTDFVVRLTDLYPEGPSIILTDGIIRASARDSYPAPGVVTPVATSPIEPGRLYTYIIDLWATGIALQPGHRLRLEVTSSCFPRWSSNLNTGEDAYCSTRSAIAHQRIVHDAEHPSFVTVQIVR